MARNPFRPTRLNLQTLESREVPAIVNLPISNIAVDQPMGPNSNLNWETINNSANPASGYTGFGIADASISSSSFGGTIIDTFDDAFVVQVNGTNYAAPNNQVDMTGSAATGINLAGGIQTIGNFNVQVQHFYSSNSPTVRILVSLTNTSGSSDTATVDFATQFGTFSAISADASGDATLTDGDRWFVSQAANAFSGFQTIARYGTGTIGVSPTLQQAPVANPNDIFIDRYSVSVPAGETRHLIVYGQINGLGTEANTGAAVFNSDSSILSSGLLNGIDGSMANEIANWSFFGLDITPNTTVLPNTLVTYTFEFSGDTANFDINDITVTGGTIGTFVAVDANTYTLDVNIGNGGPVVVSVAQGVATADVDAMGNLATSHTTNLSLAPMITTITLANWTEGQTGYSQTILTSDGEAPFSYAVTSGALPTGFSLNSSTGAITGTPTANGTFNFTVTVTDHFSRTDDQTFTVVINAPVSIDTTTVADWTVNQAGYSQTILASNGTGAKTFSVSAGALPSGLSLNSTTGAITGTPTATGTFNFTVTATDTVGASDSQAFSFVINDAVVITTTHLADWTQNFAGYMETLATTGGTGAKTFAVTSGALPAGLSLDMMTGAITGTPTVSGNFSVTITATDSVGAMGSQSFNFVINDSITITPTSLANYTVNHSGYNQTVTANGGTGAKTFAVSNGSLPIGLSLDMMTGAITGTPTATGTFSFDIVATDSIGASGTQSYSIIINNGVVINQTTVTDWTQDFMGYSQQLTSTGGTGAVTFAVTSGSLPAGLSISTAGLISGTPTAVGSSSFTITATDSVGQMGSQSYTVVINAPITVQTTNLAPWTVNAPNYNQTIQAMGGTGTKTFTLISGELPSGMILGGGQVLGSPTVSGTFNFTVQVTDAVGASTTQNIQLVVNPVVNIITTTLAETRVNNDYSQSILATGGTGSAEFQVVSGSLPAGLTLNSSTGQISGSPTTVGVFNFTIRATDDLNVSDDQTFSIVVDANAQPIVTATPPQIAGESATVVLYNQATGEPMQTITPFAGFTGNLVASYGDLTGDSIDDLIVGAGAGGGPAVKVFDGATGQEMASFFAFDPAFTGGVSISTADINNDGTREIVVAAGAGGGPHVRVVSMDGTELQSFFAYDSTFTGGVNVALGDVNNDGVVDIVTAARSGGAPHVKVFSGVDGSELASFFAYDVNYTGGVNIAVGDLNNDGFAEIITGSEQLASHVKVFNGGTFTERDSFFAFGADFSGGVRVAVADTDRNGSNEIVVGAGPGGGPHVRVLNGLTLDELDSFFAGDPNFIGGVFVG